MTSTSLVFLTLLLQCFATGNDVEQTTQFPYICHHKIYCRSVDNNSFFFLCAKYCLHTYSLKQYANFRLLRSPEEIEMKEKELLRKYNKGDFKPTDYAQIFSQFRDENFAPGGELEHWTPTDFKPDPAFVRLISNKNVKAFAISIITVWPSLGRKVSQNVSANRDRHSLIYLPYGFIATGHNSQEWRYFDNYCIFEGILVSRMFTTAKGMLDNMVHLIKRFGFIPSGGRVYYLDRSHPPLFTKMVALYVNRTEDLLWLKKNIDIVAREMDFWLAKRFTSLKINQTEYRLAQYKVRSYGVRPENILGDIAMTKTFHENKHVHLNEIKSASESGWEFSSRWIFNRDSSEGPLDGREGHPRYSNLSRIIPVDLNAILYGAFDDLAKLYEKVGKWTNSKVWSTRAEKLGRAIHAIHWNNTDGTWYDYDIEKKEHRAYFYASNLVPLWTRAYVNSSNEERRQEMGVKAVEYLQRERIDEYIGVPASTLPTTEEWDFPYALAPYQLMIVQGLRDSGSEEAQELAEKIAKRWLKTAFDGYKKRRLLYLSYDVTKSGKTKLNVIPDRPIEPRVGYGWTNGVILSFIHSFVFPYGTLVPSVATTNLASDTTFYLLFHSTVHVYVTIF